MSLYGKVFQNVAFRAWEQGVRGRKTFDYYRQLERTQWMSLEELRGFQAVELRRLLRHAYDNVPHYRAAFDSRGVTPDEVTRVEELSRLPILTKDIARATAKERAATAPPLADITKMTGGTTGEPLVFGFNYESEHWRQAMKLRGWGWAGYRLGDRAFYYWGPATANLGWKRTAKIKLDRWSKREAYADCTIRGERELAAAAAAFARHRAEYFINYTQGGVDLARYILDRGLRTWPDTTVICCAERLDPLDRPLLEKAFGPNVFETYGCREVMLIGTECEAHDGLHVSMENLVVEVVVRDGDHDRPAKPGELGEVLLTDLHNFGMPFIRYANGDLAVVESDDRCRCGRGLQRLARVEGRTADLFIDANGSKVCGILFPRVFSYSKSLSLAIKHWQAVQHKDRSLTLKVATSHPLDEVAMGDLRRSFDHYLKGMKIDVQVVPEIPPGKNGKRQTVVVE